MPLRRDRAKTHATRTPLADLAPAMPTRPPEAETSVSDNDEMLPESSATMPAEAPETDTAPANVRSRPGARKIASRTGTPAVPRTIAEMQAASHHTVEIEMDELAREERTAEEPEPPPVFVSLRTLIVMTLIPFAILAVPSPLLEFVWRAAGLADTPRIILRFAVDTIGALVALALFVRNWRTAFHDVPAEIRPASVLGLWERRSDGERRNGWATGAMVCVGGFVVLLALFLITTVMSQHLAALYLIPYVLIILFVKAVGALLFLGFLQRGLFALQSPTKATAVTALLYGISLAIWNALSLAVALGTKQQASDTAAQVAATPSTSISSLILYFTVAGLAVAFAAAWLRLRSGSLIAAVCFQLLLYLLGITV